MISQNPSPQPLVTIAIPIYNAESTILDSVRSVFAQTYKNWELLLINDGSSDKSLELIKNIDDERVRVISDAQNKGLVYRLNQIPSLATGNYLARMDADDLMHPERIEKQMEVLTMGDGVDLVDTGTYSIDEFDTPIGVRGLIPISYDAKKNLKQTMLLHASVVGKKSWFEKNPYDPNFPRAEDYELWCRTGAKSNFKRVQEPLYIVREGRVNIKNYIASMKTTRKIIYKYSHGKLNKIELMIEISKNYLKTFLFRLFGAFNKQHLLTRRRNILLSEIQKHDVERIINEIKQTMLPIH